MPEGPECRHITDCLVDMVVGKQLLEVSILGGRYHRHGPFAGFQEFNESLTNNTVLVDSVGCHGKFIYWIFTNKFNLWNTLGMSGQWTTTLDKHCHVKFKFADNHVLYFRDIRNFGTLKLLSEPSELNKKLQTLGCDILTEIPLNREACLQIFQRRKAWNICKFLMDQSYFSGIGNYLKSEALHMAKVDPFATIENISDDQLYQLYQSVTGIAHRSYAAKGASFQTFQDPDSNKGKYSFQFQVYGQSQFGDYCVKREVTPDKRSTYWVPEIVAGQVEK